MDLVNILIYISHLQDYEVLDVFFTPLENEDFRARWEAIGWPLNISKQVSNARISINTSKRPS